MSSYRQTVLTAGLALTVIGGGAVGAVRVLGSRSATAQNDSASATPLVTTLGSDPTSADPHQAAALVEAQHLFSLARVPSQAKPASRGSVAQPPLHHPGGDKQTIRVSALWTTTEPPAVAWSSIETKPPHGLQQMEDGYTHMMSSVHASQMWTAPATDAFSTATLTIAAQGPDAGPTVIEVEAEVLWVTSAVEPDATTGPRVRVTTVGGCPASVGGISDVSNPGTDLAHRMLPPGTPTGGLLCRYVGSGSPLLMDVPLGAARARTLAAAISAVRLGVTPSYEAGCPIDNIRDVTVIVLSYPDHPDVDLWYYPGGCAWLANGFVRVDATRNPSFSDFETVISGMP